MAADNPLSHVVQHPISQVEADLGFLTPAQKITVLADQIVMMIVAGVLLSLLVPMLVRRRAGGDAIGRLVPTGWANFFEVVCQYLRKEVAEPVLGKHTDRFIPYVWSAFFFLLTVNLLGLLPIAALSSFGPLHLGRIIGNDPQQMLCRTAAYLSGGVGEFQQISPLVRRSDAAVG